MCKKFPRFSRSLSMLLEFVALVFLAYSTFGQEFASALPPPPPPPRMHGPFGPRMGPPGRFGGRGWKRMWRHRHGFGMPYRPPMPPPPGPGPRFGPGHRW
ncbi:unnamed protein product [Cylicocyclus nassatus]|uniref:Uncharacterized protein n=1 Tax=Cylicocyclus nassatus TaxID=53992 RepID=A0AA36DL14_CYLNA|nr:unnamed protein product [Cylicocyclus nassatus]